jgi:hypothetical protein
MNQLVLLACLNEFVLPGIRALDPHSFMHRMINGGESQQKTLATQGRC